VRYFARQNFEGLTIQRLTQLPQENFFVGGSAAAQTVVTPQRLARIQYGVFTPGVSLVDIHGNITHIKGHRPASVEYVKELPTLPDRPKRKIKLHTRPERVDYCRYHLGGKSLLIRCDHSPYQEEKEAENVMSGRTKMKIRNKLQAFFYWCQDMNRTTYFLTLTFINQVKDDQGQKILNKFLTSLRKNYPGINYLWVAEKQQNGNLHFHMVIDRRLDVRRYNTLWVKTQFNAGVSFREFQSWPEFLAGVRKGEAKMLNPLDVKEIRTLTGVNQYLTKYVTKNDQKFSCRLWHCSRSLSALGVNTFVPLHQVKAHDDERKNQFTVKQGATHTTREQVKVKLENGEFLRDKYRYSTSWVFYVKTLNKPELHREITPYIGHYNREIMDHFQALADLRTEMHLIKAMFLRKRLRPPGLNLYPLHQYWEILHARTQEIKRRLYWIIPIVKRHEVMEDEQFSFN
jgi:hypothetical protein